MQKVPPIVWGILGVLILGCFLCSLNDPCHRVPFLSKDYGSSAPCTKK